MPQKPWFNQFIAHLYFVPFVSNDFVWVILGVPSGAATRMTVTWNVTGAVLVGTLAKLITS